jgi:hypothetical protein
MALGEDYANIARYLIADFEDYGQQILILTDCSKVFTRFKNVKVINHHPTFFSYHDKRLALIEALKVAETAIFIDADCVLRFGLRREVVQTAFAYRFPPGMHVWKVSQVSEAKEFMSPEKEALATHWGLKYDRNRIIYQEMLFAVTPEHGKEQTFFEIWNRFAEDARARNDKGAGEGLCIGIAAQASGITCWDSKYMEMSLLSKMFWHCRLNYRRRRWNKTKTAFMIACGLRKRPDLSTYAL